MQIEIREHIWLFLIAIIYCISALFLLNICHPEVNVQFIFALKSIANMLSIPFGIILGIKANYILFVLPEEKRSDSFHNLLEQAGYATITAMALVPSLIFFTLLKQTVLTSYPEILDKKFVVIDNFIHFGTDPWVILHTYMAHPVAVFFIAMFYRIWLQILYIFATFQAFRTSHKFKRMQYLITFLLVWILLGNIVAYFGASMGPCFFENATGTANESFALLMSKLQNMNNVYVQGSLDIQNDLWQNFIKKDGRLGYDISAMPSIHVAIAFLMYLSASTIGIKSRIISFIYFASIMIGSVMLGWHYAIDGYVSIIGTYTIWKTVGWALKKDTIYKEYYEIEEAKNSVSN